ncbi:N-acetylmuramoyl-L-alanine amidase [Segatella oulorum]|jgi:N-acetylmuramoyl-L-alanine amidase|uniref:N-acetylmuramoyl-L-alanine amidase n=1 Tax=Segatella oulorum TaxID=28136 RepID=UPI0020689B4D|nr:N-acetylmuramoyl-L-alanine amidase [Segatella oulorum]DAX63865.1 MAG TPA: endodeoxyribonuclease I [Caudoviricetes sp.]
MRIIKYIAVHCTASLQTLTIAELQSEFRRKGWKRPGYHYVVSADGTVTQLLPEEEVSNGVKGFNAVTINVAYIGGINEKGKPTDNRTTEQKTALRTLLKLLHGKYPAAIIQGHRDFSPDLNHDGRITPGEYIKACPCFDAKAEYADI